MPVSGDNTSAVRERLEKNGLAVSAPTSIDRARGLKCYQARKKHRPQDREVLTASFGAPAHTPYGRVTSGSRTRHGCTGANSTTRGGWRSLTTSRPDRGSRATLRGPASGRSS